MNTSPLNPNLNPNPLASSDPPAPQPASPGPAPADSSFAVPSRVSEDGPRQATRHSRVGHIARMPKHLRELVNRMLDDGTPYQEIVNELEKHRDQWPAKITSLNYQHILSWAAGGYQDWVFHQEQLAHLRAKEEFTLDFLNETDPAQLHQAGLRLAFLRLIQALHHVNVSNSAAGHPSSYAALLTSINRLSRSTLAFTQFNRVLEKETKAKQPRKGGISPEALAQIDALLGLGPNRKTPAQPAADPSNIDQC